MSDFKNRVFGLSIVKAINANFNADFSRQPRTLPDGVVYATDKAYKYMIRKYVLDQHHQKLLLWKRYNENVNPLSLDESYQNLFKKQPQQDDDKIILKNLFSCFDVKIFGATFAATNKNFSIHGALQISHGMNRYPENEIFSEQIMSPFRNPKGGETEEKGQSTLGSQYRLREGHYVYHFSLNPANHNVWYNVVKDLPKITNEDIEILKEAMRRSVSYFDSTSKAGTDNELLLWVQLHENSKKVLPNFVEFVSISRNDKIQIDLKNVFSVLQKNKSDIQIIELYYDDKNSEIPDLENYQKELNIQIKSIYE